MPRSVKRRLHSSFSPDSDWATAYLRRPLRDLKMAPDADIASVAASNRTIREENKKESYDERDDIVGFLLDDSACKRQSMWINQERDFLVSWVGLFRVISYFYEFFWVKERDQRRQSFS